MSIALLLIGFLLGPVYYIYVRHFSGQLATTQNLPIAGSRIEAVSVPLAPEMNPIGLVLRISAAHGATFNPPNAPRNHYRARLLEGERVVLDARFDLTATTVESSPMSQYRQALPLFEVDRAALYQLELQLEKEAEMQVSSIDVQVRSNMRQADWRITTAGMALLVLGVVGVLRA